MKPNTENVKTNHILKLLTRIRHLQNISFINFPIIGSQEKIAWFYTIHTQVGNDQNSSILIYVSEDTKPSFNDGFQYSLLFNDLPEISLQKFPDTQMILQLYGHDTKENSSFLIAKYDIKLSNLVAIAKKSMINGKMCFPIFFIKGRNAFYTLEVALSGKKEHEELISTENSIKKISYTYNTILKLNRLLEYYSELVDEISHTKENIDSANNPSLSLSGNKDNIKVLNKFITDINFRISQKSKLLKLRDDKLIKTPLPLSKHLSPLSPLSLTTSKGREPFADENNEIYTNYTIRQAELKALQIKKLDKLTQEFFKDTLIKKYLIVNSPGETIITLKPLNSVLLLSEAEINESNRIKINTMLGYYILGYEQATAKKISAGCSLF
ncbi:Vps38p SCDLUD_000818 [Saccharomycodes ludwigii]|uniref:Vps38p n=1 Tax=Saccharomycodes ludwigii TaxID=36035 RepID=UPI001E89CEE3|nr:hypothetical protein SCDLUD_000818 [Saccharomycodes ludwigii]KAH3903200.1 hypothetical protein SCDLUD_000818 [Saccharomycodes ludwigii]